MDFRRIAGAIALCSTGVFAAAPTVSIDYPSNGSVVTPYDWDYAHVVASATDDGSVQSVKLLVNNVPVGDFSPGYFGYEYQLPPTVGQYTIQAIAYDDEGDSALSNEVTFSISRKPYVRITNPLRNATFTSGGSVGIASAAYGPDSLKPVSVDYYLNGSQFLQSTSSPYMFTWENVQPGSYVINARVTDKYGASAVTQAVGITVGAGSDIISINFGEKCVPSDALIGVVPATHWNSYVCTPGVIYNNRGTVTPMTVSTTANHLYENDTWVINDETAMMRVYKGANGSSTFFFNNVPYDSFDVYVLWGGYDISVMEYPDVSISLSGHGTYVLPSGNEWKHSFIQGLTAEPRDPRDASSITESEIPNFVVFNDVTDRNIFVTISNTGNQPVGLNAVQIVKKGATVVQKLNLTSMCSDNQLQRRWRITNPNSFEVKVTWRIVGTTQMDSLMAPPGQSFFLTQTVAGPNTCVISWYDDAHVLQQTVKASSGEICQPSVVQKLNLTSMCSDNASQRRWRITNPNSFDVKVTWRIAGTTQTDSLMAPSGQCFFFTQSVSGSNTCVVSWYNEAHVLQQTVKASSGEICK